MARMRRTMKRLTWMALVMAAAAAVCARPELIFKVPEVRHAAVARPTGQDAAPAEPANSTAPAGAGAGAGALQPTQYYMEHEVSIADATKAAQNLDLHQFPERAMGCGVCSQWERAYCLHGVMGDHCCCERRYMREPFPWLPHACFLPAARCQLQAHNCAHYSRIRDCCCNNMLADKWKSILSRSSPGAGGAALLLLALLLLALFL